MVEDMAPGIMFGLAKKCPKHALKTNLFYAFGTGKLLKRNVSWRRDKSGAKRNRDR